MFVLITFIIHNVNGSLFFYDHHYSVIFEHPTFLDRGNSLEQNNVISCFLVGVQCMIFSLVTKTWVKSLHALKRTCIKFTDLVAQLQHYERQVELGYY